MEKHIGLLTMEIPNCSLGNRLFIKYSLLIFVIVLVPFSSSYCISWDGGAGTNNWMDEENWSGDVLPGPNDQVDIIGQYVVMLNTANNIDVKGIQLVLGANLVISNSTTVKCDFIQLHHVNTVLINNGVLNVNGGHVFGISLGGLTHFENNGTTNIYNAGAEAALRFWGSTCLNNGSLLIDGTTGRGDGLEILNYTSYISSCLNFGDIVIRNTDGDGVSGNGFLDNYGSVSINNIGYYEDLLLDGESSLEFRHRPGATLKGSGRIDPTTLFWYGGELSSDDGTGNVDDVEFYCLGNCGGADFTNSELIIDIQGTAGPGVPGGHDLIQINKNAHLGGTIQVQVNSAYTPQAGHSFDIMTYTSKTGPNPVLEFPPIGSGLTWEHSITATSITISVVAALPVELTDFSARKEDQSTHLEWRTASERNNSGFYIQKSRDAKRWDALGYVKGHGTSHIQKIYFFTDNAPFDGINYYRLKQEDFDGEVNYSDALSIHFQNILFGNEITLFPVPITQGHILNFRFEGDMSKINSAVIFDARGSEVLEIDAVDKWTRIETQQFLPGIYFLVLRTASGVFRKKFIVK